MYGTLNCNVGTEKPTINVVSPANPSKHWQEFGSWIRKMRREAEISQAEVGRRAGISENQVARIEKGESGTKRETVIALARAIGIDQNDALKKAWHAFVDSDQESFQIVKKLPPKNYSELLHALEELGIEIDWATIGNLDNYTEQDFADLLERIKFDTEFSLRRKAK